MTRDVQTYEPDYQSVNRHLRFEQSAKRPMKETPILFTPENSLLILQGLKTETRRIIKPQPDQTNAKGRPVSQVAAYTTDVPAASQAYYWQTNGVCYSSNPFFCPHGWTGDRLWVREKLIRPDGDPWLYAADNQPVMVAKEDETAMLGRTTRKQDYCPSIFMPRWACRTRLELTEVRGERLHDITEEDAKAEGASLFSRHDETGPPNYRAGYRHIWDKINGKTMPWEKNCWVWVLCFRVI